MGAGTGSVFILRWFWWRINAWSEVSAMAASFVVSLVLQLGLGLRSDDPREFAWIVLDHRGRLDRGLAGRDLR